MPPRQAAIMTATLDLQESIESPLDHHLQSYLSQFVEFNSNRELFASPVYLQARPEIERVFAGIAEGDFTSNAHHWKQSAGTGIRATAWNIERGARLEGILDVLANHPRIAGSDVLLLTELDLGMARTDNRFIARDIASALKMNYTFAPCYLALTKGNGSEVRVIGENKQALHGNAVLSRFPVLRAHSLPLPNGKDKMRGQEKRIGCQRAVIADVEHPSGMFRAVSLHLDAHSTQRHRHRQMQIVLDHLENLRPSIPVLIGGDWNTSGYNSKRAFYTIAGFWRRVFMGVGHVLRNHYLHPERWFERRLFRELDARGFNFRDLNEMGVGTLHYDAKNIAVHESLADWVPTWCFHFLHWALRKYEGRASLKLDWFVGKGLEPVDSPPPKVVGALRDAEGAVSDHDPIVVDFVLKR